MSADNIEHVLKICIFLSLVGFIWSREFRLGMLSPFRHPRLGWENNAAAASLAVKRARKEGLLEGHTIK